MIRSYVVLSILCSPIILGASAPPPQTVQPGMLVRVESELVLVDFLAFDQNGSFVSDLTAADVQLFVDGHPENVTFFQLADFHQKQNQPIPEFPLAQGQSMMEIRGPNPIVFVFDLDSMEPSSLALAKDSLKSFLAQPAPARSLYMLFSIQGGLAVRCRLTDEPGLILDAAESLSINRTPETFTLLVERLGKIFRTLVPARLYLQAMQESVAEAKFFVTNANNQLATFTEAATGLARQLENLPGRKNVVLFSSGYPVNPSSIAFQILLEFNGHGGSGGIMPMHILTARFGQLTDETGTERLRAALRELNGSQVSIYSVNMARLAGNSLANSPQAQYIPTTLQGQRNSDDSSSRKAFLGRVSASTGGMTTDWNAFDQLGSRVQADNCAYYLAAFRPGSKSKAGAYGDFEIRVKRPGIQVETRPGYLQRTERTDQDRTVAAAFEFPEVFQDFPTSATVSAESGKISVQLSIPAKSLAFAAQDGKWLCKIRLLGALVDPSGAWATGGNKYSIAREFDLSFDAAGLESFRRTEKVTAPATAQAPAGCYELILVTRQWPSGLISTFYTTVVVPEPR